MHFLPYITWILPPFESIPKTQPYPNFYKSLLTPKCFMSLVTLQKLLGGRYCYSTGHITGYAAFDHIILPAASLDHRTLLSAHRSLRASAFILRGILMNVLCFSSYLIWENNYKVFISVFMKIYRVKVLGVKTSRPVKLGNEMKHIL